MNPFIAIMTNSSAWKKATPWQRVTIVVEAINFLNAEYRKIARIHVIKRAFLLWDIRQLNKFWREQFTLATIDSERKAKS